MFTLKSNTLLPKESQIEGQAYLLEKVLSSASAMTFLLSMTSSHLKTLLLALLPLPSTRGGRQNIDMATPSIINCHPLPGNNHQLKCFIHKKLRAVVWVFWFLVSWWWPIKVGQLKNLRPARIWIEGKTKVSYLAHGNSSHPSIANLRWVISSKIPALWPG